jgi:hypothetical protein
MVKKKRKEIYAKRNRNRNRKLFGLGCCFG